MGQTDKAEDRISSIFGTHGRRLCYRDTILPVHLGMFTESIGIIRVIQGKLEEIRGFWSSVILTGNQTYC